MFRKIFLLIAGLWISAICPAQENKNQKPEVKVNVLNVCNPSAEEQQEIAAALSRVPPKPSFSEDFEVDRGRSVLDQSANPLNVVNGAAASLPGAAAAPANSVADFVRVRRDINGAGTYSTVQYSFSRDDQQMVETLVLRVREPKDLLQLSIEDSASSVSSAAAMLGSRTPASRVKLERFGKSSVVLARCTASADGPPADQRAYEPLFTSASSVLADYRALLGAATLVPEELARIRRTGTRASSTGKKPGTAKAQ